MAEILLKYSKSELLQKLREKYPDALAKFPPPHAFQFRTYDRNGKGNIAVKVGYKCTKKPRTVKDELWLEEYQTYDHMKHPKLPPAHQRFQIGNAGPLAGFDPICRPAYGAEAKDEYKRQEKRIGLYYTNGDGVGVNNAVYNVGSFMGDETFGKFSDSGFITPYSNTVKALFRFILVQCGHTADYEEFKDAKRYTQGLRPLIKALKDVTCRTPCEEQSEKLSAAEHEHSDNEKMSVSNKHNNKRLHERDNEDMTPDKKVRKV